MTTPPTDIEIGKRLKEALVNSGASQVQFAKIIGKSESTVSGYLNGSITIPAIVLFYAASLPPKTSVDWLISGKEGQSGNNVAGTIEPGNDQAKVRLIEAGQKATARNIHLRQIIEWMDDAFGQNEEQALFFYEDLKERYPSFFEFMERKRPARKSDPIKKSQAS